jgi:hypothetical protein
LANESILNINPLQVIPQYAATFGYDGERQIGREESHGTLANLSQPDIEKDFLSMLQDANAGMTLISLFERPESLINGSHEERISRVIESTIKMRLRGVTAESVQVNVYEPLRRNTIHQQLIWPM